MRSRSDNVRGSTNVFGSQCVMLQETEYASRKLYAKIGCMQRETYTSTKLQLHVYIDSQCSVLYDDGETSKRHATKGYEINGYYFSTHVSFRPPFYSCQTCSPDEVSETFNKKGGNWYDDDYISSYGTKKDNSDTTDDKASDADKKGDDYFNDDANLSSNDDVAATDDAKNNANGGDDGKQSGSKYNFNDDYYNGNRRELHFSENIELLPVLEAIPEELAVSSMQQKQIEYLLGNRQSNHFFSLRRYLRLTFGEN